ncbi:hypothetical protein OIHEL45_20386 [Sulfitobacter indolifex HEL-45]|uniref:Uncharacterized protein n=1 Tax=Sulfitobacter indolifex HEL-45 TaxID=391624 RepID=A0ABP2D5D0_9RHOB|nr:hypothetical protein OIHEL45_20386 [Sulfitobacter indolifex HEL-45]
MSFTNSMATAPFWNMRADGLATKIESVTNQVIMIGLDIARIKSMLMYDVSRKDMPCLQLNE